MVVDWQNAVFEINNKTKKAILIILLKNTAVMCISILQQYPA